MGMLIGFKAQDCVVWSIIIITPEPIAYSVIH